jgi:hypothetical protein
VAAGLKILSLVVQGFESLPPHLILKVLALAPLPSDHSNCIQISKLGYPTELSFGIEKY